MSDPVDALIAEIERDAREVAASTQRLNLSRRVLDAVRKTSRAAFVNPNDAARAWRNRPLAIGHGQTISQPFIVALMTDLLDLDPGERVLEIGTGSGYQAAILAELRCAVFSVEIIPALAAAAQAALMQQGYASVQVRVADGAEGWPEQAPFDAAIVTAAAPAIPPALTAQLRPGGRMIAPLGEAAGDQELVILRKGLDGAVTRTGLLAVSFVPLTGAQGFSAAGGTS